jgi:hypothetical protein
MFNIKKRSANKPKVAIAGFLLRRRRENTRIQFDNPLAITYQCFRRVECNDDENQRRKQVTDLRRTLCQRSLLNYLIQ